MYFHSCPPQCKLRGLAQASWRQRWSAPSARRGAANRRRAPTSSPPARAAARRAPPTARAPQPQRAHAGAARETVKAAAGRRRRPAARAAQAPGAPQGTVTAAAGRRRRCAARTTCAAMATAWRLRTPSRRPRGGRLRRGRASGRRPCARGGAAATRSPARSTDGSGRAAGCCMRTCGAAPRQVRPGGCAAGGYAGKEARRDALDRTTST